MLAEYFRLVIFLGSAFILGLALLFIPFVINKLRPYASKNAPYECGIDPISNTKKPFEIQFYIVAMIFLIFDLEIAFLVPWILNIKSLGIVGLLGMLSFFGIISVSLIYEYRKGAMDW